MPLDSVENQVDKIVNSSKIPIPGSKLYKEGADELHQTLIPPFTKAEIAIDNADNPIKLS